MTEVFGFISSVLESLPGIRGILGIILMFFLPGFAWTVVFFKKINIAERIALSVGLSIALVTLSIFALNVLIGVRITAVNSVLIIVFITLIPVVIYCVNRFIMRRR